MKILIVGAGGVGFLLCRALMDNHEVIVVDKNQEAIENISSKLDILSIHGDGKNPKLYENLDKNIDLFIAVTNSDDVNLLSCFMIDEVLHVRKKIIRLQDEFYNTDSIKSRLNLTHIILPIDETLQRFKRVLSSPFAQSIKSIEYSDFTLSSFIVKNLEKPIAQDEFFSIVKNSYVLCAIERNGDFFIPLKYDEINNEDLIYIVSMPKTFEVLARKYGYDYPKIEGCVVFGADKLGCKVANELVENGISVRVFEKDLKLCQKAQEELREDINVYHTQYGLDHNFNEDEMRNAQMVIATTNKDEYNLVKCLEAKYNSIPKVIAINNDLEYTSLMRNSKIEIIRGLKSSAFHSILEKIGDTSLVITKRFCGKNAMILSKKAYGLIGDLKLKDINQKLLALGSFFVIKNEDIEFINEDTIVQNGDILVICSKSKNEAIVKKWLEKQF